MRISIIGAGALGKTYGGLLSLLNHDVHYLMRSEYVQTKTTGYFNLHFIEQQKIIKIENPQVYQSATDLPPSDLVIISLKTTENKNIAALLTSCLSTQSIIVILQNGIGNEEWISKFTGNCPIITGVSTTGAYREESSTVMIPFLGELRLAPFAKQYKSDCEKVAELFQQSTMIPVRIYDNYKEIRWLKLLWNVPFASLSVIYSKDTQTIASNQPYATIANSLIDEVRDIAKSEGVEISKEYVAKMLEMTKKVKNYFPSMYQDYVQGKPIEKEYIIDNVLAIARSHDVRTPMLNLIASHLERND
ncbi:MAG: ketopantoate reductase family protein [Gammaproteobacteria bacterium]|nr:ketopantoate reductase family protein [Gammaproteobacteria bacterium]